MALTALDTCNNIYALRDQRDGTQTIQILVIKRSANDKMTLWNVYCVVLLEELVART